MPTAEKVRHAIVGVGAIGRVHARSTASSPFAELVAVVDPDAVARDWARQRLGVRGFDNHHDLIEARLVDAVSVATPHRMKDRITLECIEAGLHVYTEKPLAIRIGTARQLVEAANRKGVRLTVGHQYRTFRTSQTIKRLIARGDLGPVRDVLWTWHQFRPARYFDEKTWRRNSSDAGGGLLVLQLAHDLDLLAWLLGRATSVSALLRDGMHGLGSEDLVSAVIEFDGGAIVTLQASINRPPAHVVRHIIGNRAMLVLPSVNSIISDERDEIWLGRFEPALDVALRQLRSSHDQPQIRWERVPPVPALGEEPGWKRPRRLWRAFGAYRHRPGVSALLDSFFLDVLGRGVSLVPAQSALPSVEIRNAMVLSAAMGARVALPIDEEEVDRVYAGIEQHHPLGG